MTPAACTEILRKEEYSSGELFNEGESPVRFFDTNTLASNSPTEDSHSEAILNFPTHAENQTTPGLLFGIYDGHGGASCGIVTANRLQHYVAAALLSDEELRSHFENLQIAGKKCEKSRILLLKKFLEINFAIFHPFR